MTQIIPLTSDEVSIDALVTWVHVPRRGYGYSFPVDARIVAVYPKSGRACIEVAKRTGEKALRVVKISSLRRRGQRRVMR